MAGVFGGGVPALLLADLARGPGPGRRGGHRWRAVSRPALSPALPIPRGVLCRAGPAPAGRHVAAIRAPWSIASELARASRLVRRPPVGARPRECGDRHPRALPPPGLANPGRGRAPARSLAF